MPMAVATINQALAPELYGSVLALYGCCLDGMLIPTPAMIAKG